MRKLEPDWKPTPGAYENFDGAIRQVEAEARQAEGRYREILRDAIPGTNPEWGVTRLRKELTKQGYILLKPTTGRGLIYENLATGEQVRIMDRPRQRFRKDNMQKHYNDYYYRYRTGKDQRWQSHITIPDKN